MTQEQDNPQENLQNDGEQNKFLTLNITIDMESGNTVSDMKVEFDPSKMTARQKIVTGLESMVRTAKSRYDIYRNTNLAESELSEGFLQERLRSEERFFALTEALDFVKLM